MTHRAIGLRPTGYHLRQLLLIAALLSIGLFVAGGPAMACCTEGSPTVAHDCCPQESRSIGNYWDRTGSPADAQTCCTAATQAGLPATLDVTRNAADHQAAAAFSLVYLSSLGTTESSVRGRISSTSPLFAPASSPLYLRTRRLRL